MSAPNCNTSAGLAIDGGQPVRTQPFAPWPQMSQSDIFAADRVLRSGKINYWTGDEGKQFEAEYARTVGTRYAIALSNGTVALELALRALRIGPGDEVITTSRTFIASASCIVAVGATPVVAEIDRDSGNITSSTIEPLISPRTKAIIPVHLAGWPCDLDPILELASQYHLNVIEDCAQAHGATYKGRQVGSFGDINAFSFCQDKIITTAGEGGLIALNDSDQWKRAWAYKDHGKAYDTVQSPNHSPGFRWLHESFGTNWRLSEVQSAIGRTMLARLPEMTAQRRKNAAALIDGLKGIDAFRIPVPKSDTEHAYYKFYVYLRPQALRADWTRDRVAATITSEGIPCSVGSCSEIYLEKAFHQAIRPKERYPIAKELGETSLMFLVHPTIGDPEMQDTIAAVRKVLQVASR